MGILRDARLRVSRFDTRDVSLVTVFSALMAVTTFYAVPLPYGGLTHFGNTVMWIASILFGGLIGGLAGGIGGMIVDLMLSPFWAPFTFFCKLASGLACGAVSGEIKSTNKTTIARIILAVGAGAVMNRLAYAPVYLLFLGPNAVLLWFIGIVASVPSWVTYIATPIITLAVIRAYPRILTYRTSIKDRPDSTRVH
jgi:uncharacterized membrane protein